MIPDDLFGPWVAGGLVVLALCVVALLGWWIFSAAGEAEWASIEREWRAQLGGQLGNRLADPHSHRRATGGQRAGKTD